MLRRIKKPSIMHKMPKDIRHHSYGISRLVYIGLLFLLGFTFINYVFYQTYVLIGDAFVDSDARVIALEYDTHVEEIFVENGDKIKKNQELFTFDSLEFRSQLLRSVSDYSQIISKRQGFDIDISKLNAFIDASGTYLHEIDGATKNLEILKKQGNTSMDRLLTEKTREFSAYRDYTGYKAELDASLKASKELEEVMKISQTTLDYYIDTYASGIKIAPIDGVVGDLNCQPGAVIRKADTVMKIYYGKRYLDVLFEDSFVGKKEGDPVIVSFNDGTTHTIGRIVDIGSFTRELPDEIKPRYRPPGRRSMARVLVDEHYLNDQEILATAKIYKPFGMGLICSVTDCKAYLMDDYKQYLKERLDAQTQARNEHFQKNNYLKNIVEHQNILQSLLQKRPNP